MSTVVGKGTLQMLASLRFTLGALALTATLFSQAGCNNSESLFGTASPGKKSAGADTGNFPGCVNGGGIDASRILVEFAFPAGASMMIINRNGIPIYTTTNSGDTNYLDFGLNE